MKNIIIFMLSGIIISVQCNLYHLPSNVKPLRYVLTIEPNLTYIGWGTSYFYGSLQIELETLENTRNITLHAIDLDIEQSSISVNGETGDIGIESTSSIKEHQIFIIHLKEELIRSKFYNLTIQKFTGEMRSNSRGLYKAYYAYKNEERMLAVTHFEPTLARYAFPCFDEPHLKAKFVINLIRSKTYNSVSNEALESTEPLGDGRFKDIFKETPQMPTYSVAFAVSDFPSTPKVERHRILAQPIAFHLGELDYPLLMSVLTLQALEEYFQINFTLSKMDTFAVPAGYFKHFAMENWGLITFQENHLRCTNNTDVLSLTTTISYIAHEFAHQWFGNMVTAASWNYIWISESFAAYFQYYISGKVQPEWRVMDQFVVLVVQQSFYDEESQGAHPLNFRISRYGQFPPFHIMYQKGSSVVRMISHMITEEVFRKALHSYLLANQFRSVVPKDLYDSIQKAVTEEGFNHLLGGMTFHEILGTWDSLRGYPILNVIRDYSNGDVNITQNLRNFGGKQIWKIPINYVFSNESMDFSKTTADFWLVNETVILEKAPLDGWLIVNKQQFGYYRINYDLENWERLIKFLKSDQFESIHLLNRAQLINDAFFLAHIEEIPVDIPYRLAEYLVREKDYIPFSAFYTSLSTYSAVYLGRDKKAENEYFLNHPLSNNVTPSASDFHSRPYIIFREYIRTILANIRADLGNKSRGNDSYFDKLHNSEIDRHFPYFFETNN